MSNKVMKRGGVEVGRMGDNYNTINKKKSSPCKKKSEIPCAAHICDSHDTYIKQN